MFLVKNLIEQNTTYLNKKWTVYIHIVPSEISGYDWDKYYVGITSVLPKVRWGYNGANYREQFFGRAISKYGWQNIEHEIIASNLNELEAKNFERALIKELKSNMVEHGYNMTSGGDGLPDVIPKNRKDLRNQKFGRWTVLDEEPIRHVMNSGREKLKWKCRCECGAYGEIYSDHLLQGKSKSCGCLSKDFSSIRKGNVYEDIGYGVKLFISNCDKSIIIDYETYDMIKNYTWSYRHKDKAIVSDIGTRKNKQVINLLRFIIGITRCKKRVNMIFLNNDECDWRKENIHIKTPFNMSKEDYISALNENIKGLSWSFSNSRWIVEYDKNKIKHFVDYASAKCFLLEHSKEAT